MLDFSLSLIKCLILLAQIGKLDSNLALWVVETFLVQQGQLGVEFWTKKIMAGSVSPILYSQTSHLQLSNFSKQVKSQGSCFAVTKMPWTGWPRQEAFISHISGTWEVQDQSASRLGIWWEPAHLAHRQQSSFHWVLTWRKGQELSRVSCIRSLIPFMRTLPSWTNHLQKATPPNTITLGLVL